MKNLKGVFTALVTPFEKDKVDLKSLGRLIDFQLKNGVDGFVVNGTTAESPTLTNDEVKMIYDFVRTQVGKDVPIIVGTGSNSTSNTIENSKRAEQWGADALLVVVPYYNKPPQKGLFEHFKTVAQSVSTPVVLYNVPGRTITSLETKTIADLSKVRGIVGIKEATGKIEFAKEIKASCPKEFILLSGDDGTYVEFLKAGGNGVISVASHILPKEFKQWTTDALKNQFSESEKSITRNLKLIDLLFCEANPIPVKMALYKMGIISSPELRLPLVTMSNENSEKLFAEMKNLGML